MERSIYGTISHHAASCLLSGFLFVADHNLWTRPILTLDRVNVAEKNPVDRHNDSVIEIWSLGARGTDVILGQ